MTNFKGEKRIDLILQKPIRRTPPANCTLYCLLDESLVMVHIPYVLQLNNTHSAKRVSFAYKPYIPYILIRRNWGHISNNVRLQKANRIHTCENDFPEFAVLTYQLSTFSRTWYAPSLCTLQLTDNRDCVSTSKNLKF